MLERRIMGELGDGIRGLRRRLLELATTELSPRPFIHLGRASIFNYASSPNDTYQAASSADFPARRRSSPPNVPRTGAKEGTMEVYNGKLLETGPKCFDSISHAS